MDSGPSGLLRSYMAQTEGERLWCIDECMRTGHVITDRAALLIQDRSATAAPARFKELHNVLVIPTCDFSKGELRL